jgi:ribonuclease HII
MKEKRKQIKGVKYPDFSEESKFWRQGHYFVVGLDEAGRGPLAGPVTAAAVMVRQFPISPPAWLRHAKRAGNFPGLAFGLPRAGQFPNKSKNQNPKFPRNLKDSKKLTHKQREVWYKILTTHPDIKWGVGVVSEKIIDRINILEATKLAMRRAIEALEIEPNYLLLDGNFLLEDLFISQKAILGGDQRIWSCAAASIIAKVTRDRIMFKYHRKYPQFRFDKHKGYGTRLHLQIIKKYGFCKIHRLSFKPIKFLAGASAQKRQKK